MSWAKTEATADGIRQLTAALPGTSIEFNPDPQPHVLPVSALPHALRSPPATGAPGELPMLEGPPVSPKCPRLPLPDHVTQRRDLSYDLNSEGSPEYVIESTCGAYAMCFVLVDAAGRPLLAPKDQGNIGFRKCLNLDLK